MTDPLVDELWLLFHSLSASELRKVNRVVLQSSDAGLRKAYALLRKHSDTYESFCRQLAKAVPKGKRRSRIRRRLYTIVLDSLVTRAESHDADLRLHQTIRRCRILLERGLFHPADKLLRKGQRDAELYDRKWALAILAEMRATMHGLHESSKQPQLAGEARFQEAYLATAEYALMNKFRYQDALIVKLFNESGAIGTGREVFFPDLRAGAAAATHAPGFYLPYFGLHIEANIALLRNDIDGMYEKWNAIIQLFHAYPHLIPGHQINYFRALHFRTLMAMEKGDFDDAAKALANLRKARPRHKRSMGAWIQMYYSTLAQYAINAGDESALTEFVLQYPKILPRYGAQMEVIYKLLCRILLAVSCFILRDYPAALKWIADYLHDESADQIRKSIQVLATVRLCIYIELEDWETLERTWYATRVFLAKRIAFPKFWAICARFFPAFVEADSEGKRKDLLAAFLAESEALFAAREETNLFSIFNFRAWARARMEGRAMREVMAENV